MTEKKAEFALSQLGAFILAVIFLLIIVMVILFFTGKADFLLERIVDILRFSR